MVRAGLPVLVLIIAGCGAGARAEACREPAPSAKSQLSKGGCPPERRVQPYDPDRVRTGRTPGFIDLGQGTEVRIGGRVRMEYDTRR